MLEQGKCSMCNKDIKPKDSKVHLLSGELLCWSCFQSGKRPRMTNIIHGKEGAIVNISGKGLVNILRVCNNAYEELCETYRDELIETEDFEDEEDDYKHIKELIFNLKQIVNLRPLI